ncbi:MAG: type II toxin-antitoxin system HicA family toxin [Candidatus Firestonebacteria bacterium]
MRLPRDISCEELVKIVCKKYGYQITRKTGSHLRLTTFLKGEHHITIPKHRFLKIGTLNTILLDIAKYLKVDKQNLIDNLFDE